MKKLTLFSIFIILLFSLNGCSKNKIKTTECVLDIKQEGFTVHSVYTIKHNEKHALDVRTVETITATETSVIDNFEEYVKQTYTPYESIKGFKYDVKREDLKLISTVHLPYEKMDISALAQLDPAMKSIMDEGKVKYEGLIQMYKSLGSVCK